MELCLKDAGFYLSEWTEDGDGGIAICMQLVKDNPVWDSTRKNSA